MGLISRVSSRTYRLFKMNNKDLIDKLLYKQDLEKFEKYKICRPLMKEYLKCYESKNVFQQRTGLHRCDKFYDRFQTCSDNEKKNPINKYKRPSREKIAKCHKKTKSEEKLKSEEIKKSRLKVYSFFINLYNVHSLFIKVN